VMLNCGRHELVIDDQTVYLTPKEFEVLRLLIRHAGKVLSVDAILAQVWGPERIGEPDLVKQYIYRLRRKIEPDPKSPRYLHTVRGGGYYFDAEDLL
ncbi:MAG TPA: winged helix family transcriptional regulator, partial [Chloroflexi bacterium]|nr:winged helix family transcriptional regulator [Chloroflexota bacterium]